MLRFLTRVDRPARRRRSVVAPEMLTVAPQLLGRRLASPWRRALALVIDLFFISLLAQARGILLGLAAATAFFFIAARKSDEHWLKRKVRAIFAFVGASVLFVTLVAGIYLPAMYQKTEDTVLSLGKIDLPDEEVKELWQWFASQVNGGAEVEDPVEPGEFAALLEAYTEALHRGDGQARLELEPRLVAVFSAWDRDRSLQLVERLEAVASGLRQENHELHLLVDQLSLQEQAELIATYLGLTFGWGSVYFTLFLAWGNGQTPGKRCLRTRVVRLDGSPLGLWDSFERFAGYAAGLATGLLGFLQVLWDANRQGVHDKIVGTVVLEVRRKSGSEVDAAEATT